MYTGKCLSPERSGIIGKSRDYNDYCCLCNQFSKLKVLCINCQSIQSAEKRARFYALLELHKLDIVVGTESWLHKDILDSEVLPSSLGYNLPIRRNKSTDSKGGEVFILVSQRLVVSEQPKLSTNCEIVWANVEIVGITPHGRILPPIWAWSD